MSAGNSSTWTRSRACIVALVIVLTVGGGALLAASPAMAASDSTEGVVEGTITDKDGDPIEDAWVSIVQDEEHVKSVHTADDGTYSVELTEGEYTVQANAEGFIYDRNTVSIAAGETTTEDFELELAATIKGTVTDGDGNALEGVGIDAELDITSYGTQTGSEGDYSLEVPEGDYTVSIADPAYEGDSVEVSLTAGETTTQDLKATPLSTGTLEGTITDEDEEPIEEIRISIRQDGDILGSAWTDEAGDYSFEAGAGEYTLSTSADGFLDEWRTVSVAEDGTTIEDFELETAATIEGTVTDEDGTAIEGVRVVVEQDGWSYGTQTGADGEYSRDVPEGDSTVSIADSMYDGDSVDVSLTAGETTEQDLEATPLSTGTLEGTVTDEDGNPIENAGVSILQDGMFIEFVQTADDGTYTLEIGEGEYTVFANADGSADAIAPSVSVRADETTTEDFVVQERETIEGTVFDDTDTELADVPIEVSKDGEVLFSSLSQEDGSYQIELPPGEYTLSVDEDDYEAEAHEVTIEAGSSTTLDFQLVPVDDSDDDTSGGGGAPSLGPADFEVTVRDAPDTVSVGETVSVDVAVKNVGGRLGEQTVTLAHNGERIGEATLELTRDQQRFITLTGEVDESDVGEQTFTISSDDDSVETVILVEGDGEEDTDDTTDSDSADEEETESDDTTDSDEADDTETDDEDDADAETDDPAEDGDDADTVPEDDDQPGFGLTIAVLSLLGLVGVARLTRRQL